MLVKDLIEKLQQVDPNLEVIVADPKSWGYAVDRAEVGCDAGTESWPPLIFFGDEAEGEINCFVIKGAK